MHWVIASTGGLLRERRRCRSATWKVNEPGPFVVSEWLSAWPRDVPVWNTGSSCAEAG